MEEPDALLEKTLVDPPVMDPSDEMETTEATDSVTSSTPTASGKRMEQWHTALFGFDLADSSKHRVNIGDPMRLTLDEDKQLHFDAIDNGSPDVVECKNGQEITLSFTHKTRQFVFGNDQKFTDAVPPDSFPPLTFAKEMVVKHKSMDVVKEVKAITLQDCIQLFLREEQLGDEDMWYCPQCKKHQQAFKKFDMWSTPEILVIHLKRFSYRGLNGDKITANVDFPIRYACQSAWIICSLPTVAILT